jgi:ferric-dicitrate binding protein FerR (iron transport regulator)
MSSIRKKLKDFLSGKDSPEGHMIYHAWYKSFDDTREVPDDVSPADIDRELVQMKNGISKQTTVPLWASHWKVAAAVLLIAVAGVVLYTQQTVDTVVHYAEYVTVHGEHTEVMLADGSHVWLNAGTKFRTPQAFQGDTREVYLEGEAFFEIAHNPKKPFIVHAGELTTTVLGTSFNVRHYTGQPTEVAVVTGRVAVRYQQHADTLTRGQIAMATKDILGSWTFTDFDRYTGWRQGKLVFEDQPVQDVLQTVSRFYGVDIRVKNTALGACRISTTLESMTEKEVVDLLCLLLNATARQDGPVYWISGSGCN